MKAERRHELKENELVHLLEQGRDYIRDHANQLTLGLVVVVVVIFVVSWSVRSSSRAVEDAYLQMSGLDFADVETGRESLRTLKALTDASTDDKFVMAALIQRGEAAQRLATKTNPAPDPELNAQAKDAFEELLTRFPDNPLTAGIAHLGLATVAENEFVLDGNAPAHRDTARRHLQAIKSNPALNGMPLMESALERLNLLDGTFVAVKFAPPAPEQKPAVPVDTTTTTASLTGEKPAAETPVPPITLKPGQKILHFKPPRPQLQDETDTEDGMSIDEPDEEEESPPKE